MGEETAAQRREQARRMRLIKKYGKQVQIGVLKERRAQESNMLGTLEQFKRREKPKKRHGLLDANLCLGFRSRLCIYRDIHSLSNTCGKTERR